MHRRLLLAIGAAALIIVGALPVPAFAAGPEGSRQLDATKIDPSFKPMMVDQGRQVSVVLELAARPAIRVPGSKAAQASHAATLRTAQSDVAAAVRRAGGKVEAKYQHAYNGLRVRTTVGKLDELAAIAGVVAVRPVREYERTNAIGVPYVGGPTTWQSTGATGAGVLVAVIDTGIDYTHANFGGPGTEAAFDGNDPAVVEAGTFPTPKVIAGHDFAGDDYDASGDDGPATPTPDNDPLDCNGHGSHVAGSAAGFGVLDDQSTFGGIYDADTIGDGSDFIIAPGVAPEAKLVGLKVFGCEGSTDLVVDALNWVAKYNTDHVVGIDVVNMSLGAPFGSNTDPDAVMTNNLVASGVVVVASAGNEGSVDYITGAPAAANRAISVAALDAVPTLPMATIEMPGEDIAGINQNAHPGLPVAGTLHVLDAGGGDVKLGCAAGDFDAATAGKIVAVKRGSCPFVDKGSLAEAAGAIGIIVINTDTAAAGALPTFLGYNPEIFDIPMIGTANTTGAVPATTKSVLLANEGAAITLSSAGTQANPTYEQITGFSSSGPRWGDSALKPDVAAPGASVYSTLVGSGWNGTTFSGTSMAAPMTAGAAALVVQGHPSWTPLQVKAALVNTADAAAVVAYTPLRSGSGAIRADRAVKANVIATTSDGMASLSYFYAQAGGKFESAKKIVITNTGSKKATYNLSASTSLVKLSATTVTVPAHGSVTVTATAKLSAAAVAGLCSPDQWVLNSCDGLHTRSGAVTATPTGSITGQYALRVPYLLVPRGVSSLAASRKSNWTKAAGKISGKLILNNENGGHSGNADVYALGVTDAAGDAKLGTVVTKVQGTDVRAAGVQVLSPFFLDPGADPADRSIVFAVNVHDRFSSASPHEFDVAIDTDGDGSEDFVVFGYDYGALTAGAYSGLYASFVYDVGLGAITNAWLADAPLNGSTVLLPALASDLGLSAGNGDFRYAVYGYDGFTGAEDGTAMSRVFDAYAPKQSTGQFKFVKAHDSAKVGAWFYRVPSVRGWLVVTMDDRNGAAQADIVGLPKKP